MKTIGIVLVVFGGLSVLGALLQSVQGHEAHLGGLSFVVLGAFLIKRAEKKKKEREEYEKWVHGDDKSM